MKLRLVSLVKLLILLLCAFFLAAWPVVAVSISVIAPGTVDKDGEVDVNVVVDCPSGCDASYLRGVWYQGGSNYFGSTKNNAGTFVSHASFTANLDTFYRIEGSFSGVLRVKPDAASGKYNGPGQYGFKVFRTTTGGTSSDSNEVTMTIAGAATSTPSPTVTVTPRPTNSPTPTASLTPTKTPTPQATTTALAAKTPTPTARATGTRISTPTEDLENNPPVLGVVDVASATPTPVPESEVVVEQPRDNRPIVVAGVVTGTGIGLLAAGLGWQTWYNKKKQEEVSYGNHEAVG